ncbi:MAG: restriction endonuclease subunit S [Anaerolineales bacterium]|nr:restriction endonuclease subunit S [Anaerolineales bacterium]
MNPYPVYKDTGVAWLGQVPNNWGIDRIRWSVTMCKNGIWGSELEGNEGIICVRVADFDREHSRVSLKNPTFRLLEPTEEVDRILQSGDLLLEKSGGGEKQPVGFVVLYEHDKEAVYSNFIARMPIAPGQDSRYWNYLHRYYYFVRVNMRSIKQTTGIQNLDSYSYLCEQAPYPPLPEQTAIADFLDRKTAQIDAVIAKKQRLIDLLREERNALISHAVTKGLNPDAPMKDSGVVWLGQIPEGWILKKVKYLLANKRNAIKAGPFGSELKSSELDPDGEYKVYNQRTVLDRDFSSGINFINEEKFRSLKDFVVESGDFLLTTRGTIGRCVLVPDNIEPGVLHPCLIKLRLDNNQIMNDWAEIYINHSEFFSENVSFNSNATTIEVIYTYTLKEILFPIPNLNEQQQIIEYLRKQISKFDQTIKRNEHQIELLREYRTALISAVVTGKMDVREEAAV